MRNQPKQRTSISDAIRRLPQVPLLYVQFVRYQPTAIGRAIALIPALMLLIALVMLVI